MSNCGEAQERETLLRVVLRRNGVFRDTLHCEALEDAVLKRTTLAIDLVGSNSLAFFYLEMKKGEQVAVAVARESKIQPGDTVTSQWVAQNAKGYRRWHRGKIGHISNMRFP